MDTDWLVRCMIKDIRDAKTRSPQVNDLYVKLVQQIILENADHINQELTKLKGVPTRTPEQMLELYLTSTGLTKTG